MNNKSIQEDINFLYQQLEDIWIYCPTNPHYIHPYIIYQSIKSEIRKLEQKSILIEIIENINWN